MVKLQSGELNQSEFLELLKFLKLCSSGKTLKCRSTCNLPKTHKVEPEKLKAKNDNWKKFIID